MRVTVNTSGGCAQDCPWHSQSSHPLARVLSVKVAVFPINLSYIIYSLVFARVGPWSSLMLGPSPGGREFRAPLPHIELLGQDQPERAFLAPDLQVTRVQSRENARQEWQQHCVPGIASGAHALADRAPERPGPHLDPMCPSITE